MFGDDVSVSHCLTCKIDLNKDYTLSDQSISADVYEQLLQFLSDEAENNTLYIEVGPVASQAVVFGPIDGAVT